MTIRKRAEWGWLAVPRAGTPTVRSDGELRLMVERARTGATHDPLPAVGLLGGDLMRTLGGGGDAERFVGQEPIPHLPVDVVHVIADADRRASFVAHLVARRSWWRGPMTAAMNAEFIGRWDVAPRGHPNDGKFDLVEVSAALSLQQRWLARSRVRLGTHVPHPLIRVSQRSEAIVEFDRPTPIWLDGERWGTASRLRLCVEADALTVCV